MSDSDEDDVKLRPETLLALQEFYKEKENRENQLKSIVEQKQTFDIKFEEDWQLSQFWYDEETIDTLVKVVVEITQENDKIALVSCPSLYPKMKQAAINRQITLLEYDQRFKVYGDDFVLYDYNLPLDIPKELSGSFEVVIVDPPFLSEECLSKASQTVKLLSKNRIIVCTGSVMGDLAQKLLDVSKCNFEPHHAKNLGNEFVCCANFNLDEHT